MRRALPLRAPPSQSIRDVTIGDFRRRKLGLSLVRDPKTGSGRSVTVVDRVAMCFFFCFPLSVSLLLYLFHSRIVPTGDVYFAPRRCLDTYISAGIGKQRLHPCSSLPVVLTRKTRKEHETKRKTRRENKKRKGNWEHGLRTRKNRCNKRE